MKKPKSLLQAQRMRDKIYKTHTATYKHQPLQFKQVKVSVGTLRKQREEWKSKEPTKEQKLFAVYNRISRELDLGKVILRKFMPTGDVHELLRVYRTMRRYGIRKGMVKQDIQKSLIFDNMLGVIYVKESEDSIIIKAYNKAKLFLKKIL